MTVVPPLQPFSLSAGIVAGSSYETNRIDNKARFEGPVRWDGFRLIGFVFCIFLAVVSRVSANLDVTGPYLVLGQNGGFAEIEWEFEVANRTNVAARLLSLEPSCHCVGSTFEPVTIEPGQSLRLRLYPKFADRPIPPTLSSTLTWHSAENELSAVLRDEAHVQLRAETLVWSAEAYHDREARTAFIARCNKAEHIRASSAADAIFDVVLLVGETGQGERVEVRPTGTAEAGLTEVIRIHGADGHSHYFIMKVF